MENSSDPEEMEELQLQSSHLGPSPRILLWKHGSGLREMKALRLSLAVGASVIVVDAFLRCGYALQEETVPPRPVGSHGRKLQWPSGLVQGNQSRPDGWERKRRAYSP